jgi:formate/nitrite transporter FocA (FNT family)
MDNIRPAEMVAEMLTVAQTKSRLPIRDLLLRGALAGAFLGFATSLAMVVTSQGLPPIVGAAFFPVGFVMLGCLGWNWLQEISPCCRLRCWLVE